jgi:hypothetical protein
VLTEVRSGNTDNGNASSVVACSGITRFDNRAARASERNKRARSCIGIAHIVGAVVAIIANRVDIATDGGRTGGAIAHIGAGAIHRLALTLVGDAGVGGAGVIVVTVQIGMAAIGNGRRDALTGQTGIGGAHLAVVAADGTLTTIGWIRLEVDANAIAARQTGAADAGAVAGRIGELLWGANRAAALADDAGARLASRFLGPGAIGAILLGTAIGRGLADLVDLFAARSSGCGLTGKDGRQPSSYAPQKATAGHALGE